MDRKAAFEAYIKNNDIYTQSLWNAFLEGYRIGRIDGSGEEDPLQKIFDEALEMTRKSVAED